MTYLLVYDSHWHHMTQAFLDLGEITQAVLKDKDMALS